MIRVSKAHVRPKLKTTEKKRYYEREFQPLQTHLFTCYGSVFLSIFSVDNFLPAFILHYQRARDKFFHVFRFSIVPVYLTFSRFFLYQRGKAHHSRADSLYGFQIADGASPALVRHRGARGAHAATPEVDTRRRCGDGMRLPALRLCQNSCRQKKLTTFFLSSALLDLHLRPPSRQSTLRAAVPTPFFFFNFMSIAQRQLLLFQHRKEKITWCLRCKGFLFEALSDKRCLPRIHAHPSEAFSFYPSFSAPLSHGVGSKHADFAVLDQNMPISILIQTLKGVCQTVFHG